MIKYSNKSIEYIYKKINNYNKILLFLKYNKVYD